MHRNAIPNTALREGYLRHRQEIDDATRRVFESGWYILGKEVSQFEHQFAQWCGLKHCVGVGNGTDAITIALRAMGIGDGDAVFTVSHTAVATIAAIELAGAEPVLVDIDPINFTLDPSQLEEAVLAHTRGGNRSTPKAVIAVHLYGNTCDIPAIKDICSRYGMRLIEDCAQAHGAMFGGRKVGTFGDVATFSFYPTKNLGALGDGGAIATDDDGIAEAAAAIRQYGWHERYLSDTTGLNSRLDELQAAILGIKLKYLDEEINARQATASTYDRGLSGIIATPKSRVGSQHAYHLYVVRTPARDSLAEFLKARNIGTGIHYPVPVHLQKAYMGRLSVGPGTLPETECAAKEVLSLPMHPFLTPDDVDTVVEAVREWAQT